MLPHIPTHDWWWLAAGGGAGYGARYARPSRSAVSDSTGELLRLQTLYGYNAHSLVSIASGARLWSDPEIDGAVIYNEFGRVWLASGDPLAHEDETARLASRFVAAAQQQHRLAVFMPATARFARAGVESGLRAVKIGASPYFDLKTWSPRGNRAKHLRASLNQARRKGISVEAVETIEGKLREEIIALCQKWLATRRAAASFGWLFALDPFRHAAHKKFFTARDTEGNLVGFLAASHIPARDGWYLEDVLRRPGAPSGTSDVLVFEALKRLGEDGASMATLGTAPLAREGCDEASTGDFPRVERALRLTASRARVFYNFTGLRRFKAKFAPTWWESEYALVARGALFVSPRITYALTRAVLPDGIAGLVLRQLTRPVIRTAHWQPATTLKE